MPITLQIQSWIFIVLFGALVLLELWALLNALRFPPGAYVAADKRTKIFWVLLTAGAVLLGLIALWGAGSMLFGIAGIIMAGVFLADVLPALRRVMSRAQGRSR
ncbi:DUF2516 family protein [Brachybacterium huguangmaarense]